MSVTRLISAIWRRRSYIYAVPLIYPIVKFYLRLLSYYHKSIFRRLDSFATICDLFIDKTSAEFLLYEAESYLHDDYCLFGTLKKDLHKDKWNQDFKTGYIWPAGKAFYKYKISNYSTKSDIKFPWDMSRCHHLLTLGEAYRLTRHNTYSEKIKADILDFIQSNPFLHSVNWTCAMDVAIRATNWIYALSLIRESLVNVEEGFEFQINKSLLEHKFFIEKNIEKGNPYSGNHYIADLAGLIHIYVFFGIRNSRFRHYLKEFQNEVRIQNLSSGFHYEKSTSYHKLVMEMVLFTYQMLRQNDIGIDNDVIRKIKDMAYFMSRVIQPDDCIPYIGDNDNGRFLPFVVTPNCNGKVLIDLSQKIFPEENFECDKTSFYCPEANFAVLRAGNVYATIHNNPMSRYSDKQGNKIYNSHTHCDMLSFTFSVGEHNVIIDPGTYCYTSSPEKREKFRSTKMHNTFCVDGRDQQQQNLKNLFSLKQYSFPVYSTMENENEYRGSYVFTDNGTIIYSHERDLILDLGGCKLKDRLHLYWAHSAVSYFHLGPDVHPTKMNDEIILATKGCVCRMRFVSPSSFSVSFLEDVIAPSYGEMRGAFVIAVEFKNTSKNIELYTEINIE